jgi:uncharacterized protein (TIGR02453 family)
MPKKSKSPFRPALFQFLGELALNNERDWFEENKDRYENDVRGPALEFVRAIAPLLKTTSKNYVASDKKVGGSLMRVHRDVRFSKDKSPYKTNVGIQFRHKAGKDVHAPGLYLHIEADEVFLGSGTWHPDASLLGAIRKAIVGKPPAWRKARDDAAFRKHWDLAGDSLKRPPKGFDAEHACIEDLKRKDHIAVCNLKPSMVTKAGFVELVADRFAASKPYLRFLTKSQDLAF